MRLSQRLSVCAASLALVLNSVPFASAEDRPGADDEQGANRPASMWLNAHGRPDERGYGTQLPGSTDEIGLWWTSSGWKVSRTYPLPVATSTALAVSAARNEVEAAQLVVRPVAELNGLTASSGPLEGPRGATIPAANVEILRVHYVPVTLPTDKAGVAAPWPDPLPPFAKPVDIEAGNNQPLWVRVKVPRNVPGGVYEGTIQLAAQRYSARVPIAVRVYDFVLPDRMTCTTAFGFNPTLAFRYHNVTDRQQQRQVYESYLAVLGAHHISPYDFTAFDPIRVTWPKLGSGQKGRRDRALAQSALTPEFDWTAWDAAMEHAMTHHHFNSFRLSIPGLGGGTFHARYEPELLGYGEETAEYKTAFTAYCRAVEEHLQAKGWLDEAFVYWFDEPDPKDYAFVMNGFRKLKEAAPKIQRMLTEQVEPALVGGPNIWCPLTPAFDLEAAARRRAAGDRFWWYVCTGPKAPYATLFIDHAGTELRVWLWQTWKRRISGILVWQTNYWTSSAAYPDDRKPQNPYLDPMGWRSGYSTPAGVKKPWGNGDGRFIYPPEAAADGRPQKPVLEPPVASIRLEMLRDGIEDYEYMVLLAALCSKHQAKLPASELRACQKLLEVPAAISADLTHFTVDPAPIEKHREAVARAIEKLSQID